MSAQFFNQSPKQADLISMINHRFNPTNELSFPCKTFKRGDYIYLPNKTANHIYLIKEGRVKIGTHNHDGKEVIKKIAIKGEIFGEFSLIGQTSRKDYAITMEKTEIYLLTIEEVQQLMKDNRVFSNHMMTLLGNRLIEMEQRLESLVFKSSRDRIIDFLDRLVQRRGQRVGYEMLVRQFFTHQEIANFTATSRQTVTMVLNELRNKNILTFNRRRLLIRDMDLLRAEAA